MANSKKSAKSSNDKSPNHNTHNESFPRNLSADKQTMKMLRTDRKKLKTSHSNSKRPREESSTKPPPKLRQIKGLEGAAKQRNVRFDPRFSSSCGQFDEFRFHQDYAFLDQLRQDDIQELKKAFRKAKSEGNIVLADRIQINLLRLTNQQKAEMERQKMEQIRAELRRENMQRMNRGERPIYLNNAELMARSNDSQTDDVPNS